MIKTFHIKGEKFFQFVTSVKERYNSVTVNGDCFRREITVSQALEIASGERYNFVTVNGDRFGRDLTVSLTLEIASGEISLCHSQ